MLLPKSARDNDDEAPVSPRGSSSERRHARARAAGTSRRAASREARSRELVELEQKTPRATATALEAAAACKAAAKPPYGRHSRADVKRPLISVPIS